MGVTLSFNLFDPSYSVYHQAGLGGLAMAIDRWSLCHPKALKDVAFSVTQDTISTTSDILDEKGLISLLTKETFRISEDGLIDLPTFSYSGFETEEQKELKVLNHRLLCQSFLSHCKAKSFSGENGIVTFVREDESTAILSFRKMDWYYHQDEIKSKNVDGTEICVMKSHVIPGASAGSKEIETPLLHYFVLKYLMISCPLFQVIETDKGGNRIYKTCVVVPHVTNLVDFVKLQLSQKGSAKSRSIHRFVDRYSSGSADSLLRFTVETTVPESQRGYVGATAIALHKTTWCPATAGPMRSGVVRCQTTMNDLELYRAAYQHTSNSMKRYQKDTNEMFVVVSNDIPDLIAQNIVNNRFPLYGFVEKIKTMKVFKDLLQYRKKGFAQMINAISDETDKAFIALFQSAWRSNFANVAEKARNAGNDLPRAFEKANDKMCLEIRSWKTHRQARDFLCQFLLENTTPKEYNKYKDLVEPRLLLNEDPDTKLKQLCALAILGYEKLDRTVLIMHETQPTPSIEELV